MREPCVTSVLEGSVGVGVAVGVAVGVGAGGTVGLGVGRGVGSGVAPGVGDGAPEVVGDSGASVATGCVGEVGLVVDDGPGVHDNVGVAAGDVGDGPGPPACPTRLASATPASASATIHAAG